MEIRLMQISDYDQVRTLWQNTPGMGLNDKDDSPEGIAAFLKRNPKTCFVAVERDEIVGVILSGHDGRRGFIYHTAVALNQRKNGIGSALVEAALAALRTEGIKKVALVAFAKNELANQFWEKRGFSLREDLAYRNKALAELTRIDT